MAKIVIALGGNALGNTYIEQMDKLENVAKIIGKTNVQKITVRLRNNVFN